MTGQQKKISVNLDLYEQVKGHPFFSNLPAGEAQHVLSLCLEKTFPKDGTIFKASQQRDGLLLVLQGAAEVYVQGNSIDDREVLEIVKKDEIIGFSSLADFLGETGMGGERLVEVRAIDNVHALSIPFSVIRERWTDPDVRDYILLQVAVRLKDVYSSLADQVKMAGRFGEGRGIVLRVQDVMSQPALTGEVSLSVQEAAKLMVGERTSSLLVTDKGSLAGILTEKDLVNRIVSRALPADSKVTAAMTRDPFTIKRTAYFYEALSVMLVHGVKHLPVLEEGRPIGVVTLSDLLRKKNENMVKVVEKLETAGEEELPTIKNAIYDVLGTLLEDEVPVMRTLDIITGLYDRLVSRVIDLALEKVEEKPPVPFAFYQMGSSGRGEQFLLTDQDHFLVFGNTDKEEVRSYFQSLSEEIVRLLEKAGYAKCNGNMMASSAAWRGTVNAWQERLRQWNLQSTNEALMLSQVFFSNRFIFGSETLDDELQQAIVSQLDHSKIFLYRLAQREKVQPVPVPGQPLRALFGLQRKEIDLKKNVLFPFHHSLQILAFAHRITSGTPLERIRKLAGAGVFSSRFEADLEDAFSIIMKEYVTLKYRQYSRGESSSSILKLNSLSTKRKEELLFSLRTIKDLQSQMFSHFSL